MKNKIKFEVLTKIEKTGLSELDQGDFLEYIPTNEECDSVSPTFYFRLCSMDTTKEHKDFKSLKGRKLKITVETVD